MPGRKQCRMCRNYTKNLDGLFYCRVTWNQYSPSKTCTQRDKFVLMDKWEERDLAAEKSPVPAYAATYSTEPDPEPPHIAIKKIKKRICAAVTKSGKQCRRYALIGSEYCRQHKK